MKVIDNLYYSREHEWLKVDGDKGYVGITDYAQHKLGDIVYIELPEVEDHFAQAETFGVVESVKSASDLECPVSGTIVEVNHDIEDEPELVNSDAYENWFICIRIDNTGEFDTLLSAEEYVEYTKE